MPPREKKMENEEASVKKIKPKNRRIMGGGRPEGEGDECMTNSDDQKWLPEWVEPLLVTRFFGQCETHADCHKSECNMYCLDCASSAGAFCSLCLPSHLPHHRPIQIRRSSYHDVVRVSEIQKFLDISGVQTYVINSARIVFLNERPQPRPGKALTNTNPNICLACHRTLLDSFLFCSLGCKIVGPSKNFSRKNRKVRKEVEGSESEGSTNGAGGHTNKRGFTPVTPPPRTGVSYRTGKRRKGVPHRAPMGVLIF